MLIKNLSLVSGYFYSTAPLLADIEKRKTKIFEDEDIKDINFNIDAQFSLAESLQSYCPAEWSLRNGCFLKGYIYCGHS